MSAGTAATTAVSRRAKPPATRQIMRDRYPARGDVADWPTTRSDRDDVWQLVTAPPYVLDNVATQHKRRRGLTRLLDWLQDQPGSTWQQRWLTSGVEAAGTQWRRIPLDWLAERGFRSAWLPSELSVALAVLVGADVLRPSLAWLVAAPAFKPALTDAVALGRDPSGFARLMAYGRGQSGSRLTASRMAVIVAAKGGSITDVTVGDVLELADTETAAMAAWPRDLPVLYSTLKELGILGAEAPARWRQLRTPGQRTPEELVDRYDIACQPVRDLLVDYLRERQPGLDYNSLRDLSYFLACCFWKDLETHHPGIDSLRLTPQIAAGWKERVLTRPATREHDPGLRISHRECLAKVRAFYLDLSQWALEDPARWAWWVAPCPIAADDLGGRKAKRQRKARMDARTRERLPVLPVLVRCVERRRTAADELLHAAITAEPGAAFTAAEQTLIRPASTTTSTRVWVMDPTTGRRRDLATEADYAFWAWATVEVLRLTGVRIEEMLEISHHSLVQYRLPTTGELVPLLQIAPSKTDTERLLVVSPELADVLSTIIQRVRLPTGAVALVPAYDWHECVWRPPAPLLFQRRFGAEHRAISHGTVRKMLHAALADTGLVDPANGKPLAYTPHDFRRMFITDTIMNGLPPHIAQVIVGHHDINVTLGYKAIYPDEAIQAHLAFLARRRSQRPGEEYRVPTDAEWEQFLGHWERRKVSTGLCGRAYSTPCIHEHACLRCAMHWPDPAQRTRIVEIRDNLQARIAEAEREGWLGEVEGLQISLAGANDKLAQIDRRTITSQPVDLGLPTPRPAPTTR
jgi:hypothetical protein